MDVDLAMRLIRMYADYGAFPVWDVEAGGMVDPDDLPIDADLRGRLQAWADRYDATHDADPSEPAFESAAAEQAFEVDGRALARELQAQLGAGFDVRYGND